jgi:hypothetical protein
MSQRIATCSNAIRPPSISAGGDRSTTAGCSFSARPVARFSICSRYAHAWAAGYRGARTFRPCYDSFIVKASINGYGHSKKRRPSPKKKATAAQQAALKKYLEMTNTHVSPERMAEIRAEWEA